MLKAGVITLGPSHAVSAGVRLVSVMRVVCPIFLGILSPPFPTLPILSGDWKGWPPRPASTIRRPGMTRQTGDSPGWQRL